MPSLIGFVTGLLALVLTFVGFKLSAVLLGSIAILVGVVAQTHVGWIGLVLGIVAIMGRFVLAKSNGKPTQPNQIKPA